MRMAHGAWRMAGVHVRTCRNFTLAEDDTHIIMIIFISPTFTKTFEDNLKIKDDVINRKISRVLEEIPTV